MLVGGGCAALRRLTLLDEARAQHIRVFAEDALPAMKLRAGARLQDRLPREDEITPGSLVMTADLDDAKTRKMAELAHKRGAIVNAEDKREFCDVHVPSIVRRGDLLISISTGGKSPRLARRIKAYIDSLFDDDWGARLARLGRKRDAWRKQGRDIPQLVKLSDAMIERHKWLKDDDEVA